MNVENFWRQLKHGFLHHLLRSCLDQLLFILAIQVISQYVQLSTTLEPIWRQGRSKLLTTYQKYFKSDWKRLQLKRARMPLQKRTASGRNTIVNAKSASHGGR